MLIYAPERTLIYWAAQRLGIDSFGPATAIGVARGNEIVAVAVFNNYRHPNIEISFVTTTPRWASRQNIKAILRYPFLELKVNRLTAVTDHWNRPARAFLERLGFKQEGYHPEALPTGDAVTYGMLACDASRWIEDANVKAATSTTGLPASNGPSANGIECRHGNRQPGQSGLALRVDDLSEYGQLYRPDDWAGDSDVYANDVA